MIVSGIRGPNERLESNHQDDLDGRYQRNRVFMSTYFAGKWYDMSQGKHHRWKLTPGQLQQYALAGLLSGARSWWEDLPLEGRRLSLLAPNGWLCVAPLICEDLAQLEPCTPVIRGVGPTLVLALLLDGPQLTSRWPGRYASVLADDPGSSVLTVTSLGTAMASRRGRHREESGSRTVALWKDLETGAEAIDLAPGAGAVVLTVAAKRREEFTADGRTDYGQSAVLRFLQAHQLSDSPVTEPREKEVPTTSIAPSTRLSLHGKPWDLGELTRLTFAIDAVLDSMRERWWDMLDWADAGRRKDIDRGGVWRWKPALEIWKLIDDQMRPLQRDELSHDDLGLARDLIRRLLDRAVKQYDASSPRPSDRRAKEQQWWLAVLREAKALLATLTNTRAPFKPEPTHRLNDPRDVARVHVLVGQSLLWALHLRWSDLRSKGELSHEGEAALHEIETAFQWPYEANIERASRRP